MYVLSVQQPWAWSILQGFKRVENRTWGTAHRGPLLIHAGVSRGRLGAYGTGEPDEKRLTFGAILGVVDLVDVVELARISGPLKAHRFAEGPVCWVLENPRRFRRPVPLKGRVGLFKPPADFRLDDHLPAQLLPA